MKMLKFSFVVAPHPTSTEKKNWKNGLIDSNVDDTHLTNIKFN
jgi:hypothetical protein